MLQVMEQVTNENCEMQPDGKARCGFTWCAKLFKGKDFLQKHLRNRHPEVAVERLVRVAEKYMLSRFNAEDLIYRPLPAIEVESSGGIETKSVREVFEAAQARLMGVPMPMAPAQGHGFGGFGGRGGGRGGRGRGDGMGGGRAFFRDRGSFDGSSRERGEFRGDRRVSGDFHAPPAERRVSGEGSGGGRAGMEYQAPKAEDNNARKLHSYLDVDSPMVSGGCPREAVLSML